MRHTVRLRLRHEIEPIKGSRFVSTVGPASTEDEARALLDEVRAEWPAASHHCSAWRIAEPAIDRASDDGEPSGSAGRPILAALTGRDLVDTAVVVTRWFGGTKLGVGGLVRAYGRAAAAALDQATIEEWLRHVTVLVEHGHADTSAVDRVLQSCAGITVDVGWGTRVQRTISLPESDVDRLWQSLADATAGRVLPSRGPTG